MIFSQSVTELGCLFHDMEWIISKVKALSKYSNSPIQLKNCEYSVIHLEQQFSLVGLKVSVSNDKLITFID